VEGSVAEIFDDAEEAHWAYLSSIGIAFNQIRSFSDRLEGEFRAADRGFAALGALPPLHRGVVSDQIVGAAQAMLTNLAEARVHEQDANTLLSDGEPFPRNEGRVRAVVKPHRDPCVAPVLGRDQGCEDSDAHELRSFSAGKVLRQGAAERVDGRFVAVQSTEKQHRLSRPKLLLLPLQHGRHGLHCDIRRDESERRADKHARHAHLDVERDWLAAEYEVGHRGGRGRDVLDPTVAKPFEEPLRLEKDEGVVVVVARTNRRLDLRELRHLPRRGQEAHNIAQLHDGDGDGRRSVEREPALAAPPVKHGLGAEDQDDKAVRVAQWPAKVLCAQRLEMWTEQALGLLDEVLQVDGRELHSRATQDTARSSHPPRIRRCSRCAGHVRNPEIRAVEADLGPASHSVGRGAGTVVPASAGADPVMTSAPSFMKEPWKSARHYHAMGM
jgi:hypothetical protein